MDNAMDSSYFEDAIRGLLDSPVAEFCPLPDDGNGLDGDGFNPNFDMTTGFSLSPSTEQPALDLSDSINLDALLQDSAGDNNQVSEHQQVTSSEETSVPTAGGDDNQVSEHQQVTSSEETSVRTEDESTTDKVNVNEQTAESQELPTPDNDVLNQTIPADPFTTPSESTNSTASQAPAQTAPQLLQKDHQHPQTGSQLLQAGPQLLRQGQQYVQNGHQDGHQNLLQGQQYIQNCSQNLLQGQQSAQSGHQTFLQGQQSAQNSHQNLLQGQQSAQSGQQNLHRGQQHIQSGQQNLHRGQQHIQNGHQKLHQGQQSAQSLLQSLQQGQQSTQRLLQSLQQGQQPAQSIDRNLRQGQQSAQSAQQNILRFPNPNCLFEMLCSRRTHWSDPTARSGQLHRHVNDDDELFRRFLEMTRRTVLIADGSVAFDRGYWPKKDLTGYLTPPASNPDIDYDVTSVVPSQLGLSQYDSVNLPLPVAWIEDVRIVLPQPPSLGNIVLHPDGSLKLGMTGKPLRDYSLILPDRISSKVEGWRMHFWFTIDSRITYEDIIARMHFKCHATGGEGPLAGGIRQVTRTLADRVKAFRRESGIFAPLTDPFDYDTYEVTLADSQAISKLSKAQLDYGTWWCIDQVLGVMYPPPPKDSSIPYRKELYVLPYCAGPTLRMRKILEAYPASQSQAAGNQASGPPVGTFSAPQVLHRQPAGMSAPAEAPKKAATSAQKSSQSRGSNSRKRPAPLELDSSTSQKRVCSDPLLGFGLSPVNLPGEDIGVVRQAQALMKRRST